MPFQKLLELVFLLVHNKNMVFKENDIMFQDVGVVLVRLLFLVYHKSILLYNLDDMLQLVFALKYLVSFEFITDNTIT